MDILQTLLYVGTTIIDFIILWVIIYGLFKLIGSSVKTAYLFKGLLAVIIIQMLASLLDLTVTSWIINQFLSWFIVIVVVLFAQEIRSLIEEIGRKVSYKKEAGLINEDFYTKLEETLVELSKTRTGALITIEGTMRLNTYMTNAHVIQGEFSKELMQSIFNVVSPMHDGAVVIRDGIVQAAGVYFPVDKTLKLSKKLGTRHRAALSFSEETDAMTFIVSEETGAISIAHDGKLYYDIDANERKAVIDKIFSNDGGVE